MSTNSLALAAAIDERVELERYSVQGTERIVCAEQIDDLVQITDHPARAPGRCYLIERCRTSDGSAALQALVADYTRQARRIGGIPMVADGALPIDQVELARYRYTGGQRILYGQRVNGTVRVTDRPASGPGRSYLVECGVECDDDPALQALLADYTEQAGSLDESPMASGRVRRIVERSPSTRCPRSSVGAPARVRLRRPAVSC